MPKVHSPTPKIAAAPGPVKPYLAHGVHLTWHQGAKEAKGNCPFCLREGKFTVNTETGQWRCFVCNQGADNGKVIQGGNCYTFLRKLWEAGAQDRTPDLLEPLRANRRLLKTETLEAWGIVKSPVTGNYLVPGYGPNNTTDMEAKKTDANWAKLNQLYRYSKDLNTGKMTLYATPECQHQLHGLNLYDTSKSDIYLCEGPWDGMALWEAMGMARPQPSNGRLVLTANPGAGLLGTACVLAVPGCNVFRPEWTPLFAGKNVHLMYDSDHPKQGCAGCNKAYSTLLPQCPKCGERGKRKGATLPPVGYEAMKKVALVLSKAEQPPKSIKLIKWGTDGYDEDLPDGTDVRDVLCKTKDGHTTGQVDRVANLQSLLSRISPMPADWQPHRTDEAKAGGNPEVEILPCTDWATMIGAWKKAMEWTEGLDRALGCMLASILSTKTIGDQLWMKIIGPASCGKSTLCEAVSTNKKYVLAKSAIRGFHSGFKSDAGGEEDNSLLAQLYDKTLVTKDGDTLLQSPNLPQILSEARDIYDRTSRTHYRNRMGRNYEGVNMTWLLCGTGSLRAIDSSELGERFLDCVIMEGIDVELEDSILWRVANRVHRTMSIEMNGAAISHNDPDLVYAMQLTGGYVSYLREQTHTLLAQVKVSSAAMRRCITLGKFVAYMRARPSKRQAEQAEREFAARLVSQLVRLAKCTAVVINHTEVDDEVLRRVHRVALDTARGRTLDMCRWMYQDGNKGMGEEQLERHTHIPAADQSKLLSFLRKIGAVESYKTPLDKAGKRWSLPIYRLTERMAEIYKEVMV